MAGERSKGLNTRGKVLLSLFGGLILGGMAATIVIVKAMPTMMIEVRESRMGFEETVAALEESIAAEGWTVAGVRDMNQSLAKQGVDFPHRIRLVELCKAEYAESVLASDRPIATMMPCTFAVYEGDDGGVYISKMNLGLMAKLFGGNVAEVMGGAVVEDEHRILAGIIKGGRDGQGGVQ